MGAAPKLKPAAWLAVLLPQTASASKLRISDEDIVLVNVFLPAFMLAPVSGCAMDRSYQCPGYKTTDEQGLLTLSCYGL